MRGSIWVKFLQLGITTRMPVFDKSILYCSNGRHQFTEHLSRYASLFRTSSGSYNVNRKNQEGVRFAINTIHRKPGSFDFVALKTQAFVMWSALLSFATSVVERAGNKPNRSFARLAVEPTRSQIWAVIPPVFLFQRLYFGTNRVWRCCKSVAIRIDTWDVWDKWDALMLF
jgi:hypothetical protein